MPRVPVEADGFTGKTGRSAFRRFPANRTCRRHAKIDVNGPIPDVGPDRNFKYRSLAASSKPACLGRVRGFLVLDVTARIAAHEDDRPMLNCEVVMKRFVVAALLFFPDVARAEYFDTGNDLWELCTDKFPGHQYLCTGLPAAYLDMMIATGYRCESSGLDREQARDAVFNYLKDNPERRKQPASELALTALKAAFKCVEPAPAPLGRPAASTAKSSKLKAPIQLNPIH